MEDSLESLELEALDYTEEVEVAGPSNSRVGLHVSGISPLQKNELAELKITMIQMQNQMKKICEKMQGNKKDPSIGASVKRKASVIEEASELSDDIAHSHKPPVFSHIIPPSSDVW